jgi:hypothetical protein
MYVCLIAPRSHFLGVVSHKYVLCVVCVCVCVYVYVCIDIYVCMSYCIKEPLLGAVSHKHVYVYVCGCVMVYVCMSYCTKEPFSGGCFTQECVMCCMCV